MLRAALPEARGVVVFQTAGHADTGREPKKIAAAGAEQLTYRVGETDHRVSAGSFFQVNRHLTADLVAIAGPGLAGELALDLYAGVGLFSTVLARSFAQVIAVESSQTSHADLCHNSPVNVKAVRATTARYLETHARKLRADLVIMDPPRGGLGDAVVRNLLELKAQRLVYVSCDPATLARDLARLAGGGYRIEQVHLVDLFPQTYHLESVFHLIR
jgi:23S rRNA (uracil1939-C5)-methyltransferase